MEIIGIEPILYTCKVYTLPLSYTPKSGEIGIEPTSTILEIVVLPLNYSPKKSTIL